MLRVFTRLCEPCLDYSLQVLNAVGLYVVAFLGKVHMARKLENSLHPGFKTVHQAISFYHATIRIEGGRWAIRNRERKLARENGRLNIV